MLEAKIGACFIYKKAGENKPFLIIKIGKGLTGDITAAYQNCKIDPQFVHFIDQTVNSIFALPFEVSPLIATENLERVLANLVKPLIEPTETADGIKPPEFDFNLAFPLDAAPCEQLFVIGAQDTKNHCIGRAIQAELDRRIQEKLKKLFPEDDTLTKKAKEALETVKRFEQESAAPIRKASFLDPNSNIGTVLLQQFRGKYSPHKLDFLINVITYIRNSEKGIYTHLIDLNNRKLFNRDNFLINCIKLALIEEAFYAQKKLLSPDETMRHLSGVSAQPVAEKIEITPEKLLNAISEDNLEQVVACLEYIETLDRNNINIFLSTTNANGENALLLAAKAGLTEVVKVLILFGVDLTASDKNGKTALVHLLENKEEDCAFRVLDKLPFLTKNERAILLSTITVDHLKTAPQRERIGELLTYPSLTSKSAHEPKAFREAVRREYRSRKDGRTMQILHHFSTKIYDACYKSLVYDDERSQLIEAQALYLAIDGKDFLFFAMNNIALNPFLFDIVKILGLKKSLIFEDRRTSTSGSEIFRRNTRYARKFNHRVFNNGIDNLPAQDQGDLERAKKLAALIRTGGLQALAVEPCIGGQFPKSSEDNIRTTLTNAGGIFFLNVQDQFANSDPHSEELLAAIVKIAKKMSNDVHSEIAGQRRPCRTCKATLFASKVDRFEQSPPGSLWIGRLSLQSPEEALLTVKSLLTEPTGVSMNKFKREEEGGDYYASGSDSEAEEIPKKRYSGRR